jgi:hypothetical protein
MTKLITIDNLHVPILFVLVGVLANRLGRRDSDISPMRNFWAVGTTVFLMSLGSVAADTRNASSADLNKYLGWIIIFIVLLFISLDQDRYRSWDRDDNGKPTDIKNMFWGILLPDIVSVISFAIYRFTTA